MFSTHIPRLASDRGYVTDIDLTIGRKYRYRGSAAQLHQRQLCGTVLDLPARLYELAKATFSFADGQQLTSRLPGDCKVR